MTTLYLDLFSGISGDMLVGALIDLGVDPAALERDLRRLEVGGYHLHVARRQRCGIQGTQFEVQLENHTGHPPEANHGHHAHPHAHRTFLDIRELIRRSPLSAWAQDRAVAVFHRIAVAEGRIHGLPPDQVHFHEVGAVDSIVDIVGACLALEQLGKPRVLAGPVIEGTGWVQCAHGRYPLPVPATLAILGERGFAISQTDEPHELVTPTGAALLAEFAESCGPLRDLVPARIGYGVGARENRTRPNVLRVVLGDAPAPGSEGARDWETDTVSVIETNLDDLNPEILGDFAARALAAGALDVMQSALQMKKGRPGILLTVIAPLERTEDFAERILRETSAFGVRITQTQRRKLRRELIAVTTPYGAVTVKIGRLNGRIVQAAPEYESCRERARQAGVPLKEIYAAAVEAAPRS